VVFLQQRGPIAKNKNASFAKDLVDWLVQHKFSQVVIVSSADAAFRIDPQFDGLQSRFIASPSLNDSLVKVLWIARASKPTTLFLHLETGRMATTRERIHDRTA